MLASFCLVLNACHSSKVEENENEETENEHEKYDSPSARELQEFNKTKDPATGTVPIERLWDALDYTLSIKQNFTYDGVTGVWEERGPIYDSVGSSNSNGRGGNSGFTGAYTSGRISGFLVDADDATGNTVFCGGVNGGIWKCTNFASTTAAPNWIQVNDYLSNMSIVSFCQNPVNKEIMYAATGEGSNNVDAVRGNGIFKSTDHGATWTQLSATTGIRKCFKILCDANGNLFYATAGSGLRRSTNGGTSFTTITPTGASTYCTDIEISSTGRLHASFGYGGTTIAYRFTSSPATVASNSWSIPSGLRTAASRFEIAVQGDTIYGVTTNSSYNVDSCYRSTNGGASWAKMNTAIYPTAITNKQGWYAVSLAINPNDANQIIVGSVDAYLSTDAGATVGRFTYWVGNGNYVHADHHLYQWWKDANGLSKLIIACDGGMFYSEDDGGSFVDKNKNLAIKQFYSCAIHPTLTNYILGGAQDNGVHQLKNQGLSYSTEVTGGDGGFVDIDQDQPQYQFGSYTNNVYRRSTNGGNSWSSFSLSTTTGDFINPWDYDDAQNIMLCGNNTNDILRWTNPQTAANVGAAATAAVTLTELGGFASAITVSPYTVGRAFIGSSTGTILVVNNTKTTTGTGSADVVDLNAPLAGVNTNCIAVGTNDSNILVVYSNYGINNLWITNDMGATWTAVDGNLPDMPVRWAVFHPTQNNKVVIGTEAGVFTTANLNGSSTQWTASPGFPLVKVDMLKLRKSDNTIVAATHGRGMWTANILSVLPIKKISLSATIDAQNFANLKWSMEGATTNAKYVLEYSNDGIHFNKSKNSNVSSFYKQLLNDDKTYFRVMGIEFNMAPIFSNIIVLKSNKSYKGLQIEIAPNPMNNSGKISLSSAMNGAYSWKICNVQGSVLQIGNGNLQAGIVQTINTANNKLHSGMYIISVTQNNQTKASSFIKL